MHPYTTPPLSGPPPSPAEKGGIIEDIGRAAGREIKRVQRAVTQAAEARIVEERKKVQRTIWTVAILGTLAISGTVWIVLRKRRS